MSELTVRRWRDEDRAAVEAALKRSYDLRGVKSKGAHTFVAEEGGKVVGISTGRSPAGEYCLLDDVRSLARGRLDVIWALVERQAQNGLELGYKRAKVRIPHDVALQCTNVMDTPQLVEAVKSRLTLTTRPEGMNVATKRPAWEVVEVEDLELVRGQYEKWLNELGCKRTWL